MSALSEFFAPVPLWFIGLIVFFSLILGTLLCMPNQWAERFFRMTTRFFRK